MHRHHEDGDAPGRVAAELIPDSTTPADGPALLGEDRTGDSPNGSADRADVQITASKAVATLQARAALAGIALHRLHDGGWLASRWGLTRELRELRDDAEAAAWLARMGAGS